MILDEGGTFFSIFRNRVCLPRSWKDSVCFLSLLKSYSRMPIGIRVSNSHRHHFVKLTIKDLVQG
ncbi:hypothetical protein ERO13_A08G061700v2 [Gossypium hirsutum]|uniref:Uncharacterized protein n=3 Tax=Gossypium TaxID=3633 RepID=A0A5D2Y676_GOSMU|nr:hypothetical protein ERO13_A08G061700v2 [Gossypium hirsutum]TYH05307.1 hypothetical protein ES288_A08G072800v1 [Gossypium darwinii]TYI13678.1 hypothetical protein ES332_A08G074100v1 [Gossypium tomentosum]TYJ21572.1 hypothetical protein E1A91_A08G072000v1 [Gossypium mustelinum]